MKRSTKRTAACLSGLPGLLTSFAVLAASPADKVYTIANYPVEATAKDAVAAKEKAHTEGQQAALGALLKRLVPVTAYNRIDQLKYVRAADFIDGVAIRSENNSNTQYIANLDFVFQAAAVRDLLTREGVPFIEEQSPRMVLVPVTVHTADKDGPRYRPAGGSWAQVWKGLDLDNTLTPLRIEPLLPVIHDDTIDAAIAGDDSVERVLTGEYKADFVLIAAAEVDAEAKKVYITLAGIDPAGMLSWRRGYRVYSGDTSYAMELAAVVTQAVIEGRWKAAKSENPGAGSFAADGASDVHLAVEFTSLAEWNDLRRQLLDVPGVDDVRIGAVSARSADVSLRYPGGGDRLAQTLAGQGLSLTGGGGLWTLRGGY